MSDLLENKNIKPMLIGVTGEAFDSPDFLFELKFDGERCIAYLSSDRTELRNKMNMPILPKFPELKDIHRQVTANVILDGELIVTVGGKPDFFEVQRRSLLSNSFKIDLGAANAPATFVAFDILYMDGQDLTSKPLTERKQILESAFVEAERLARSRFIDEHGTALYSLAEEQEFEGIIAKRKDSIYVQDKRTKDWIKIKNLQNDNYVICGYILKDNSVVSLVLGQYAEDALKYKGHVPLEVSGSAFEEIRKVRRLSEAPFTEPAPKGNEEAYWVEPVLVCTVKYMEKHPNGSLRQPVFKGLREGKYPRECAES